jgi:hypothetical protein
MNETLIVGYGEIGNALYSILKEFYPVEVLDIGCTRIENYSPYVMHICFPCFNQREFIKEVNRYKKIYKPKFVVIHSTVPVGTCSKLKAIHSPVEGLHPHLKKSILTFTKFLSGKDADKVADYFRRVGIKVYITDKSETTEYMKIMSTTFYGLMIEFHKQVKSDCDKLNIPFELFTIWNKNYNESYERLGYPEYKKPLLVPIMGNIGQHCVLPNSHLLKNDFTEFLLKRNQC